jgi:hypothetical protein
LVSLRSIGVPVDLIIAERDWSRGTVLWTIRWKFEIAYTLSAVAQRDTTDGSGRRRT